jgi:hypothetical protein
MTVISGAVVNTYPARSRRPADRIEQRPLLRLHVSDEVDNAGSFSLRALRITLSSVVNSCLTVNGLLLSSESGRQSLYVCIETHFDLAAAGCPLDDLLERPVDCDP